MKSSDEESYHYFAVDDSNSEDELTTRMYIDITEIGRGSRSLHTVDAQEMEEENDEEEIQIIKEILVKTPSSTMSFKKEKASILQPAKEILENGQICASKDTQIETSSEKQSSVTFEYSGKSRQSSASTVKHQHADGCSCRQPDRPTLKLPRAITRLQDFNNAGDKEKELPRRRKPFTRSGLTNSPLTRNPVSNGSGSGETTVQIHNAQGNEPVKMRNGDITGCIDDRAIGQTVRSQEHLSIKIGSADVAVTKAELSVQITLSDVSISGQADDVTKFVSKFNQFEFENFIKK